MPIEVKLPELGPGIESGDVLEILVREGDIVQAGQDIVEMETDKASVPVPSSASGKVTKIHVQSGQTVPIGGLILELEQTAGAPAPTASPPVTQVPAQPTSPLPSPPPISTPPVAAPPVAAPPAPVVPAPAVPPPVLAPIPTPTVAGPIVPQANPASTPSPASPGSSSGVSGPVIPAGPAVRRFAREVGVDLSRVYGSGDGGRITRDDVLEVVRQASQAVTGSSSGLPPTAAPSISGPGKSAAVSSANPPSTNPSVTPAPAGESASDEYGAIRVERMTKIRKTIAQQMHLSWSSVPRVTNFDDADITDLERLRVSSKDDYAAQGIKLTTMPFLIKAVATALRHHPMINAQIDADREQIVYKDYINVGVAVDTDRGLVVPVLHNTDRMGIPDIARKLAQTAANVRGGQFAISDLRGGTFTISNLGAIGGQYSTPIVNIPEVAILLVGRSRKLPVVMPDDSIQPRLMMPLSLSYDHRLVDGGTAARFLNDVISYLEAPSRLLLAL